MRKSSFASLSGSCPSTPLRFPAPPWGGQGWRQRIRLGEAGICPGIPRQVGGPGGRTLRRG